MQGLHVFTLFGVPVFVSVWFVVIVVWWGMALGSATSALIWGVTVTFSILVHEFGHAMVARHYRLAPRIVLHGWGGLCAHDGAERDGQDALIMAAGPGAGLALGGLVWLFWRFGGPIVAPSMSPAAFAVMYEAVHYLLYVNLIWSLVNLLPLWPLDGGQLYRLGLVRWLGGARGERIAHLTGVGVGVIAAAVGWNLLGSTFIAVGGLFLAYMNYQRLSDGGVSGPVRPRSTFAKGLLADAEAALAAGAWREAARLGHQIRSLTVLNDDVMRRTWEVLAVATARLGEPEEALGYARRAPDTPRVRLARARALLDLGRTEEARAEVSAIRRVPAAWRAEHARLVEALGPPEDATP